MSRQRVAFITGVSSGIGQGLSHKFLSEGWKVYGSVRKKEDASKLSSKYKDFSPLVLDVTQNLSIREAINSMVAECPDGLDLLINNAGIAVGGPLVHVPMEEFRYQFEVNLFGLLQVTQGCYPLLRKNDRKPAGRIIQMSSVSGKIGFPFLGPYVSSKFALEGLTESLRRELMLDGIDVVTIGPGAVKTPIWEKSVAPVAASYQNTAFAEAIKRLNEQFVSKSISTALPVEWLCQQVYLIATASRPKARYTFMSRKLTNYLLPRLLPTRWLDRILAKQLFR